MLFRSRGRVITAEDVEKTGASNIWEALKYTVRSHYFSDYKGEPTGVSSHRGRGSIILNEEPLVILDGARIADFTLLRHVPAVQIRTIRILSGTDGMTYYGTNSTGGVIVIETMLSRRSDR